MAEINNSFTLFLQGAPSDDDSKSLNLWVQGVAHEAEASLDLYLCNLQSGVEDYIPLYISGEGNTPNAYPFSKSLNLVLKRKPAEMLPLYLHGPGEETDESIDLFVHGSNSESGWLPFSIPEVVGVEQGSVRLFTRGF